MSRVEGLQFRVFLAKGLGFRAWLFVLLLGLGV